MLIRKRDKDTLNELKWSVFDTYKTIHENEITVTAILFFVCISKNIGNRVLPISHSCFLVTRFWMSIRWALYDNYEFSTLLHMGVVDSFGAGGGEPKLKGEPPNLVSVFLAWQVTVYLRASLHGQRNAFWDSHCHCSGWYWWMMYLFLKLMRTP